MKSHVNRLKIVEIIKILSFLAIRPHGVRPGVDQSSTSGGGAGYKMKKVKNDHNNVLECENSMKISLFCLIFLSFTFL